MDDTENTEQSASTAFRPAFQHGVPSQGRAFNSSNWRMTTDEKEPLYQKESLFWTAATCTAAPSASSRASPSHQTKTSRESHLLYWTVGAASNGPVSPSSTATRVGGCMSEGCHGWRTGRLYRAACSPSSSDTTCMLLSSVSDPGALRCLCSLPTPRGLLNGPTTLDKVHIPL